MSSDFALKTMNGLHRVALSATGGRKVLDPASASHLWTAREATHERVLKR